MRRKCPKVCINVATYLFFVVVVEKQYFLNHRICVSYFPAPFRLPPSERPLVNHRLRFSIGMKSVVAFFRALFSHTCFFSASTCQTPERATFFKHLFRVPESVDHLTRVRAFMCNVKDLMKCLFSNAYNYYFLIV